MYSYALGSFGIYMLVGGSLFIKATYQVETNLSMQTMETSI
jgi:hypothetical protein